MAMFWSLSESLTWAHKFYYPPLAPTHLFREEPAFYARSVLYELGRSKRAAPKKLISKMPRAGSKSTPCRSPRKDMLT